MARARKLPRARKQTKSSYRLWKILASLIFFAVIVYNLYGIFRGDENLLLLLKLQKESENLQTTISQLEQNNKELKNYIQELRNNPDLIEEEVRSRLNLIKENEELFVLPETSKNKKNLQKTN